MGNQKGFIAQIDKLKKEIDFAANMAIQINADRLKYLERIEVLESRIKKQNVFIADIADNWDCDEYCHTYNLPCRKCTASQLLQRTKPKLNDTEQ